MIRPRLHEALGFAVQARLTMREMMLDIISEMQQGYRPTYRGHAWDQRHFQALENAALAIDVCFDFLKWLQFPEIDSRLREAEEGLRALGALPNQVEGSDHDGGHRGSQGTQPPPRHESWELHHDGVELGFDPGQSVV